MFRGFLQANQELLGVQAGDLVRRTLPERWDLAHMKYQQAFNGIPIGAPRWAAS